VRRSERDQVLRAEVVSPERLGQAKTLLRTIDGCFCLAEERLEASDLTEHRGSGRRRPALADELGGPFQAGGTSVALAGPKPRLRHGEVGLRGAVGVGCRNERGSCLLEQVEPLPIS